MHSLQFTAESSSNGMLERDFTVGEVPGVLWSPASGAGRAPLILMAHGGGNHKKHPAMLFRARAAGEPEGPIVVRYNDHLAQLAVPEYEATLDAL